MIIFCNSNNEIKDVNVNSLGDETLTEVEIDDTDNPFAKWSNAKICCYKCTVIGGKVTMMTPYLDSRLIEHIEQLGKQTEFNASDISDNREGLTETFESTLMNTDDISMCREAIEEIYEMIIESEVE